MSVIDVELRDLRGYAERPPARQSRVAYLPRVLMGSVRRQQVALFRQDILAGKQASYELLFRVLYGIPADLQIELARTMTARYLPVFRSHRKDLPWVEQVLAGIAEYFSATDGGLPEPGPDDLVPRDIAFVQCVFLLARAWEHAKANKMGRLTAACGAVLAEAIHARAGNVWRADDPVAVRAFESEDTANWVGQTSSSNAASQAVSRREWLLVADWLDAHDVGSFPDISETDMADCEQSLTAWKDREYLF